MPLRVPDALRFASGSECELPEGALHDFMGLLRKSRGGGSRKSTLETFKEHFARCCGSSYAPSSDLSWTETDLDHYAHEASANAPAFIAAFYDACEELAHHSESAVPGFEAMNAVLASAELPYRIEGDELVCIDDIAEVLPPVPDIGPDEIVARALKDAKALIGSSGASSGVDRLHTALHGYLRRLCEDAGAKPEPTAQTGKLFKLLRQSHPALLPSGPRSADIGKVLNAMANVADVLSPIRNKATLAHANQLLDEPEALLAINAVSTVFRYLQDSLGRYRESGLA